MLWSGWVIETPAGKVYFSGCTGYAPLFQEIGKRLGPMRLSFIADRRIQPALVHAGHARRPAGGGAHPPGRPVGAVRGHALGTFKLTDEHLSEPPVYLKRPSRKPASQKTNSSS